MFKCYKPPTSTFFFPPVTGPEAAPSIPVPPGVPCKLPHPGFLAESSAASHIHVAPCPSPMPAHIMPVPHH